MISFKNYITCAPKTFYDTGEKFVKSHKGLMIGAGVLTAAALAYFSSDLSTFIRNLPQPPLSVSSFSKPEVKIDSDKGTFFNKITTKIEYDQIENPTLYGQVVNYIKTGTLAAVKTTPQTHSLSEKYEFSILGNLLHYPIYSTGCATTALAFHQVFRTRKCRFYGTPFNCFSVVFLGGAVGSFILDQVRQKFLGV